VGPGEGFASHLGAGSLECGDRVLLFSHSSRLAALGGKVVPSGLASLLIATEPIMVFLLSSAAARTWRLNGTLLAEFCSGSAVWECSFAEPDSNRFRA